MISDKSPRANEDPRAGVERAGDAELASEQEIIVRRMLPQCPHQPAHVAVCLDELKRLPTKLSHQLLTAGFSRYTFRSIA